MQQLTSLLLLQVHKDVKECLILSSLCETAHAIESDLGEHAFAQIATAAQQVGILVADRHCCQNSSVHNIGGIARHMVYMHLEQLRGLLQAVQQHASQADEGIAAQQPAKAVSVQVQHFPMHCCPLTSTSFVLPAASPLTSARSAHLSSKLGCKCLV